jgi:hypothetical protein
MGVWSMPIRDSEKIARGKKARTRKYSSSGSIMEPKREKSF